jgi:hypothetical protein
MDGENEGSMILEIIKKELKSKRYLGIVEVFIKHGYDISTILHRLVSESNKLLRRSQARSEAYYGFVAPAIRKYVSIGARTDIANVNGETPGNTAMPEIGLGLLRPGSEVQSPHLVEFMMPIKLARALERILTRKSIDDLYDFLEKRSEQEMLAVMNNSPWLLTAALTADSKRWKTESRSAVDILVEAGFSINSQDFRGYTVLHDLVLDGNKYFTTLEKYRRSLYLANKYYSLGCDLTVRDHDGRVALDYAAVGNSILRDAYTYDTMIRSGPRRAKSRLRDITHFGAIRDMLTGFE